MYLKCIFSNVRHNYLRSWKHAINKGTLKKGYAQESVRSRKRALKKACAQESVCSRKWALEKTGLAYYFRVKNEFLIYWVFVLMQLWWFSNTVIVIGVVFAWRLKRPGQSAQIKGTKDKWLIPKERYANTYFSYFPRQKSSLSIGQLSRPSFHFSPNLMHDLQHTACGILKWISKSI